MIIKTTRYSVFIYVSIAINLVLSCNSSSPLIIRDGDGDCLLVCSTDSLCGRIEYYYKDSSAISFDYTDDVFFSKDDPLDTFLMLRANELYGEDRLELGYTILISVLFNSDLQVLDVRLISKNMDDELKKRITKLIKLSEGYWCFKSAEYNAQPYYLKFIRLRLY